MLDRLQPMWVDSADAVSEVVAACSAAGRFALDSEADSLHSYFHKVCLIQVSAGERHFLIDPLALAAADLQPLWRVVGDGSVPVVMHGADYDLRVLDRDFGARVRGLEDTQVMAQLLGEPKTGLGVLLEREFDVRLDKRHQRADWGQRPLSRALLGYAAADTAFLVPLADRLRARLEELGRRGWAVEECRRLEEVRHQASQPDPLAFERIKGARALRGEARDRAHALHAWRERIARQRDLPPFKVLGNRPLLELASDPPGDLVALGKVSGLGSRFVRRWGGQVIALLRRPGDAPPSRRGERPPRAEVAMRRRIERLVAERDRVAAELGLPPGLVCPRAVVEAVANARAIEDAGVEGWRLELLGERFARALAEE